MHQGEPLNFGVAPKPVASPEVLGEIASMDNVFGYVTEHDMRFESTVRKYVPSDKRFWICNGSMILLGTLIGCNGTTTAFSNIWPDAMKELLKLGIDGKYRIFAESVDRAVLKCNPLRNLPLKNYEDWSTMVLRFNPEGMMVGQ